MSKVAKYASLVKFSHTVFALPFALAGYFYAVQADGYGFDWGVLIKVVLCMIFARNTAMGFNRWADRKIDADNPRTANREIPAGKISPFAAMMFVVVNSALFLITAGLINHLTALLSPVALVVILGYSYTKRFTWLSHFILGLALSIAPVGAYIAVCGTISILAVLLACLVISWVGGFDILYSLQDVQFDRSEGLHSVPSSFSVEQSLGISLGVHMTTLVIVWIIGRYFMSGSVLYWVGAAIFAGLLIAQHILITPKHLKRAGAIFAVVNGLSSLAYASFFIASLYLETV